MGNKQTSSTVDTPPSWIWQGQMAQPDLAAYVKERVEEHLKENHYSRDEVKFISKINEMPVKGSINVSAERLEKLRRLCQLWEVDLRYQNITSHRKIVGPLIVAMKRLLYPVIRAIFKDYIRQQKEFNAAAIALLADLSNATTVIEEAEPAQGKK